jgi:hypothetical protein
MIAQARVVTRVAPLMTLIREEEPLSRLRWILRRDRVFGHYGIGSGQGAPSSPRDATFGFLDRTGWCSLPSIGVPTISPSLAR